MRMQRGDFSRFATALVAAGLLTGCGSDTLGPTEPEDVNFHPSVGVNLAEMTKTESGLYYQVIEEGTGEQVTEVPNLVTFEYTMWLSGGQVLATEQVGSTNLGGGGLNPMIEGVDEGLTGMKIGERRRLVVPYYLGWGAERYQEVPGFSTVVFVVEVLDIET